METMVSIEFWNLLVYVAVLLITAGAVYGGIRADIKKNRLDIAAVDAKVSYAHRRIDDILTEDYHARRLHHE